MPKLCFIALFLFTIDSTAQESRISWERVFKTFQKTINKPKDGKVTTGNSAWYTCNDDSAYHKMDTIRLIYHTNRNDNTYCCNTIGLTFYDVNLFLETRYKKCEEPSSASAAQDTDFYKIRMTESSSSTFISFINNQEKGSIFKILDLIETSVEDSKETSYELILKRWVL